MTESSRSAHVPVLSGEVLASLGPETGKLYIDATLGLGGHTSMILEASAPTGRVIGFEWDADAAAVAVERLAGYGDRFRLVRASYADLIAELTILGVGTVDGILVDLGVSSLQLDNRERGFSFLLEADLDMRMNRQGTITAADIVARLSEEELADILYHYGEERQARRIARFIVKERESGPIRTTLQLANIVAAAVPRKYHPRKKHVATRTFQALRIAVNRELDNLAKLLVDAPKIMKEGARLCVITFHSLEDRMVKQAFASNDAYKPLGKPIEPGSEEVRENRRARSAKLRVAVHV